MPKMMQITIDVQEEALGRVLNSVNGMRGVGKVHLHLSKAGGKLGEHPGTEDGSKLLPSSVILAALGQGRPLSKKQLEGILTEAGVPVAANTVHGSIYQLRKKKLLVNGKLNEAGEKAYAITAAGKKSLAAAAKGGEA